MYIKQIIVVSFTLATMGSRALDMAEVIDVKARQRYPWNGLVDIDYQLDSKATEPYFMKVTALDNVGKTNLTVKTVYAENVSQKDNPCMVAKDTSRIVWDAAADLPNGFKCTNVLVSCFDTRTVDDPKRYLVLDLSAGSTASSYPVSYRSAPPSGGWTDEFKTTKLVFRRIEAGSFMMGSPADELGRQDNEDYHRVILTRSYYLSIFEVTEKQWALVMGTDVETCRPARVNYTAIRGKFGKYSDDSNYTRIKTAYCWPESKLVDPDSFMGRLRSRVELTSAAFDLPTEAQWEYAARGGSISAVHNGQTWCQASIDQVGRNVNNRTDGKGDAAYQDYTIVGSYEPNSLGIYDMLGNVTEWCVDAFMEHLGSEVVEDPEGPTGTLYNVDSYNLHMDHVLKGGGYVSILESGYGYYWLGSYCPSNAGFTPTHAHRSAARATPRDISGGGYYRVYKLECGFRVMGYAE